MNDKEHNMAAMSDLHARLTDKGIDPEGWESAYDAGDEFADYLLSREVLTYLRWEPCNRSEDIFALASRRWPVKVSA